MRRDGALTLICSFELVDQGGVQLCSVEVPIDVDGFLNRIRSGMIIVRAGICTSGTCKGFTTVNAVPPFGFRNGPV